MQMNAVDLSRADERWRRTSQTVRPLIARPFSGQQWEASSEWHCRCAIRAHLIMLFIKTKINSNETQFKTLSTYFETRFEPKLGKAFTLWFATIFTEPKGWGKEWISLCSDRALHKTCQKLCTTYRICDSTVFQRSSLPQSRVAPHSHSCPESGPVWA